MRYLKVELKRALLAPAFWLAVIGFLAILVYCNADILKTLADELKKAEDLDMTEVILSAVRSHTALFAIPILATVPFSCSILDDLSSHFIKSLFTRVSKLRYAVTKTAAVALAAGLTAMLGVVLYAVSIYGIIAFIDEAPTVTCANILSTILQSLIYFAYFAMWGVFGAICGMLTDSKCVTYCAPFILYYVLVIIKSRYLHTFDAIDPRLWSCSATGIATIVMLAAAMCIGAVLVMRRRIKIV